MIGHLHCDVFNQHKMLINGVEMRVRPVRSKDAFCLMDVLDENQRSQSHRTQNKAPVF